MKGIRSLTVTLGFRLHSLSVHRAGCALRGESTFTFAQLGRRPVRRWQLRCRAILLHDGARISQSISDTCGVRIQRERMPLIYSRRREYGECRYSNTLLTGASGMGATLRLLMPIETNRHHMGHAWRGSTSRAVQSVLTTRSAVYCTRAFRALRSGSNGK